MPNDHTFSLFLNDHRAAIEGMLQELAIDFNSIQPVVFYQYVGNKNDTLWVSTTRNSDIDTWQVAARQLHAYTETHYRHDIQVRIENPKLCDNTYLMPIRTSLPVLARYKTHHGELLRQVDQEIGQLQCASGLRLQGTMEDHSNVKVIFLITIRYGARLDWGKALSVLEPLASTLGLEIVLLPGSLASS